MLTGDVFDKRHTPMEMLQEEVELFIDQVISKKKAPKRRRKPAKKAAANPETIE